ncbi:MAG TPA: thiamine diphosphokinase [Bacillota bacterium]|nr:thiamine diphosphokinase [Bacillota bacterium]
MLEKGHVAIVANADVDLIPDLSFYKEDIDTWIGLEKGALFILDNKETLHYALGDFDSVNEQEKNRIKEHAKFFRLYPSEKDQTDLEIAIEQALCLQPKQIILFGVTGGRKDHELVNIQMLYTIARTGTEAIMIDKYSHMTLKYPGSYTVNNDTAYPYISFVAFTPEVTGMTLEGFKYPLTKGKMSWGSTLCVSNQLLSNTGTFSHDHGILLLIKSRDVVSETIQG